MTNPKITSLQQLKDWNEANKSVMVTELPIVFDWFMEWFFGLLDNNEIEQAKEAYSVIQQSTTICNNCNTEQAKADIDSNFRYWNEVRIAGTNDEKGEVITTIKPDNKQKLIEIGVSYVTI